MVQGNGGASKTGVGGCGNGGQKPHPRDKPGSPPTGQAHRPHSCTDFSWGMGRQWRVPQLRVTVALSHPKRGSVVQNWAILGTWEQVKPTKAWNSPVRAPRWEPALGGSWGELESGQANSAGIRKLLQALKCVSNGRAGSLPDRKSRHQRITLELVELPIYGDSSGRPVDDRHLQPHPSCGVINVWWVSKAWRQVYLIISLWRVSFLPSQCM